MLKRFGSPTKRLDVDYYLERVHLGGHEISLPRKPLRVLLELLKAAPEPKGRNALIEDLWDGNFLTGEKGLTQALWSIRVALETIGGDAKWIRTVARFGYQWAGPPAASVGLVPDSRPRTLPRRLSIGAAACCALAVSGAIFGYLQNSDVGRVQKIVAANGTIALINQRAIMVSDHQGRHVNFLAEPPAIMRSAAFSTDGEKIFISVSNGKQCQIRVFEFNSQHMESYETCAHQDAGSV